MIEQTFSPVNVYDPRDISMRMFLTARQLILATALATSVAAQRRGGPPAVIDPAATADIIVRPVRNGAPDVQYVDIREVFTRSSGVTNDNFAVQVPEPPPG